MSDDNFEMLLRYMKSGKGGSIAVTVKKAQDIITKLEEGDTRLINFL